MTLPPAEMRRSIPDRVKTPATVRIVAQLKTGSPIPIYYQLAQAITRSIDDGAISRGVALEANHVIAGNLGISLGTVRRAFRLLDEKAILRREMVGSRNIVTHC